MHFLHLQAALKDKLHKLLSQEEGNFLKRLYQKIKMFGFPCEKLCLKFYKKKKTKKLEKNKD